ncbi:sortase B protein-sorting domain-containing protein [Poseidonibacter sp.]
MPFSILFVISFAFLAKK